jgi:serine protease Do
VTAFGVTGVLVDQVSEGPAQAAGLLKGDLIVMLNRQPVTQVEQFNTLVMELPAEGYIPIRIMRQDQAGNLRGTTLVLELK